MSYRWTLSYHILSHDVFFIGWDWIHISYFNRKKIEFTENYWVKSKSLPPSPAVALAPILAALWADWSVSSHTLGRHMFTDSTSHTHVVYRAYICIYVIDLSTSQIYNMSGLRPRLTVSQSTMGKLGNTELVPYSLVNSCSLFTLYVKLSVCSQTVLIYCVRMPLFCPVWYQELYKLYRMSWEIFFFF